MAKGDVIKVAVDVSKGILVQAKGHPAKVVGYAAAAGVAFVATALGYGAYQGTRYLFSRRESKQE